MTTALAGDAHCERCFQSLEILSPASFTNTMLSKKSKSPSSSNQSKGFKAYDYVHFVHEGQKRYGYVSLILTTTEELDGKRSVSHTLYIQENVVSDQQAAAVFKDSKVDKSKVRVIEVDSDGKADPVKYTYVYDEKAVTFCRHGAEKEYKQMCAQAGFPTENPKKLKAAFKPKQYDIVRYEIISPKAHKLVRSKQLAVVISRSYFPHEVVPPSLASFQLDCVRVIPVKKGSENGQYALLTPSERDLSDQTCIQKIPVHSLKFIEHGVDWKLREIKAQAQRLDNPEPAISHGPGSHRKRRIAKKTVKVSAWTVGGIAAVAVGGPLLVAGFVIFAVVNFVGGVIATVTSPIWAPLAAYIAATI